MVRILVIEDDPGYALLVTEVLEDGSRFACEIAPTAREARARGFKGLGAIVLDYDLPDGGGLDLLREIIAACETPVVVLIGENVVKTAVVAIRAGAFSYLVKTAENLEVLPEIVGQAVEEAARRRERREMAAQVQRAENLASLGTLAAGLCQEMNNPLAAIIGYVDLYRAGLETNVGKCMDVISKSARRLRDVVDSLSAFASGRAPPMDRLDLAALVRSELERQAGALSDAGVSVVVEAPDEPVLVEGNRPTLEQLARQLIRNAHQAMRTSEETRLTVRVSRAKGRGGIEVEDTGPGVPAQIQARIFDAFFTTRAPAKGMGMGLAISHRIVNGHGGTIRYEPSPSGGSMFVVEIPVAGVVVNGQTRPPSAQGNSGA